MEEIAVGVTPAMDSTPAGDPFMQQLIAEKNRLLDENNRLRSRNEALERRLAQFEQTYDKIATIVQGQRGAKGLQG